MDTVTVARANAAVEHYRLLIELALSRLPPDHGEARAVLTGHLDALEAVVHEANTAHAEGLAALLGDRFVTDEGETP